MAANERAVKALNAMKDMGISEKRAKPVLKNLLRLYDRKWQFIEEDHYTALVEAIFEQEKEEETTKTEVEQLREESAGSPLKKMRLRGMADAASASGELMSRRSTMEGGNLPITRSVEHDSHLSQVKDKDKDVQEALVLPPALSRPDEEEQSQLRLRKRSEHHPIPPESYSRDKGKDSMLPSSVCCGEKAFQSRKHTRQTRHSFASCFREPKVEPGIIISPKEKMPDSRQSNDMIVPKSEPVDDYSPFEVPISIMPPVNSERTAVIDQFVDDGLSTLNGSTVQVKGVDSLASKNKHNINSDRACEAVMSSEFVTVPETPMSFEIASSPLAEVKISLSCSQSFERPGVHVPSVEEVLKAVEDKCLRSYRVLDPNFSILKVFQETCQSFLDLSRQQDKFQLPTIFSDGSSNGEPSPKVVSPEPPNLLLLDRLESRNNLQNDEKANGGRDRKEQPSFTNSDSLGAVSRQEFAVNGVRPHHDLNDISKGQERVRISVINEVSSEPYPSSFYYIRRNTVYKSAYLNFSLARIGNDCCHNCFGDCLSSSIPCACARDTGGDFAYTLDGLVKEDFLKECLSMIRDPSQHFRHFCCKQCPKEGLSKPCKGHLVKRYIKECWSKCGCSKQCGNRVVQRGIPCNLQVFFTSEGKGWGVRTLQNLPKGTFVCEYVGEVLTSAEIYDRNMHITGNDQHTYPVLLDAAWGLEGDLKEEHALCLDGKYYGNVARFINHRCFDASLVEIPVKIETPDNHYYHLALFTTRDVDALEELTWDYGIQFNDDHHSVKAFRCLCKSNYCRDLKRYRRTRFKRTALQ